MTGLFTLLADLMVVLHGAYVLFVVGGAAAVTIGGFRSKQWIRNLPFRLIHLGAIAVVAIQELLGLPCPLTVWEYQLREAAGHGAQWELSFVARILHAVIYYDVPDWVFTVIYIGFALLVLLLFMVFPPRRRRPSSRVQ